MTTKNFQISETNLMPKRNICFKNVVTILIIIITDQILLNSQKDIKNDV